MLITTMANVIAANLHQRPTNELPMTGEGETHSHQATNLRNLDAEFIITSNTRPRVGKKGLCLRIGLSVRARCRVPRGARGRCVGSLAPSTAKRVYTSNSLHIDRTHFTIGIIDVRDESTNLPHFAPPPGWLVAKWSVGKWSLRHGAGECRDLAIHVRPVHEL
jgi:hypothetical protein